MKTTRHFPCVFALLLALLGGLLGVPAAVGAVIYVNAGWVGTPPGTDPDGPFLPATNFGADSFATIQDAVNAAAPGDFIVVYAGVYPENVVINKALNLLGPNFGKAGSDPTRGAEAIVRPAVNNPDDSTIFSLEADNIVVDGFLFDGDNPLLGPGYAVGAADVNVSCGIQNGSSILSLVNIKNTLVQNNVFRNFPYQGVYFEVPYLSNYSWNYIRNNKFETMWEGIQTYAMHAVIEGNVFADVGIGLSMHSVAVACDVGFAPKIANNIVSIGPEAVWNPLNNRTAGIWVNYRRGAAPPLVVSNNVVNTPVATTKKIIGFLAHSVWEGRVLSLENNTVNGLGNCDVGFEGLFFSSDSTVTVKGGVLTGLKDAGIRALTYDANSGSILSTNPVYLTVEGVGIDGVAGGAGLDIGNPTASAGTLAVVTVKGGTYVSNSVTGVALTGQGAQVAFTGASPAKLGNVGMYLVEASNGSTAPTVAVDATAVELDGKLGAAMTEVEGLAVEDKVTHKLDDSSLGLVTWHSGNYYVTLASGSLQRGLDVTGAGQNLHVQAGAYPESILINKLITITSPGSIAGATFTVDAVTHVAIAATYAGSTVNVINGGVLTGSGTVGSLTINGTAHLAPGTSPGTLTVATNATWAGGGIYDWEINDAAGTAGNNPGWDLLMVGGQLTVTATPGTPFVIKATGTPAGFNPAAPYSWKIAGAVAGIAGFAPDRVTLDLSGLTLPPYGGQFKLVQAGGDLLISYFPSGVITVTPPGGGGDFNSIQAAVNASAPGGTVLVYAGTYVENVVVNKALKLLGPNAGNSGCNPLRAPEAIVQPAVNNPDDSTIFSLEANNISVDGFLFDGDNPLLGPGYTVGAADVNVSCAIQNGSSILSLVDIDHVTIQNNVFRNLSYQGVYLEVTYLSNRSWNYIVNNKFQTMWEGIQTYAMHAVIEGNCMSDVGVGLSMHSVAAACDVGFAPKIANNTVRVGPEAVWNPLNNRTAGIWVNYRRGAAPPLVVSNNVVNTPVATTKKIIGFLAHSVWEGRVLSLENNTVNGMGNCDVGVEGLFFSSDSTVTVKGGVLTGLKDAGIRALTYDANSGAILSTNPVHLTVEGVGVDGVASGAGLDIGNPTASAGTLAVVTVKGGTYVSNSVTGVALTGQGAQVAFTGASPAKLGNVGMYLVEASNGSTAPTVAVDATAVEFDGKVGTAMTAAELFATEDKVTHKVDSNPMGLVTWLANNVFVTPTVGSIQNGVAAAVGGDTINVQSGAYAGAVNLSAAVILAPGTVLDTASATLTGNLTFGAASTYTVEINGAIPGASYDQMVVNGAVDLGNANLNASVTAPIPPGTDLVIIANDGVDAVTGTFNGLAQGATVILGGQNFVVYYNGNDGNDVVLRRPTLNTAPALADTVVTLTPQNEDSPLPAGAVGTLVSQLVDLVGGGGQNNVTDPDIGAVTGMAVIGADVANGSWYFTTDGGTTWSALGPVSSSSARLLAADALTRVYFVPNLNYNGTIGSALTFRAWDQFTGSNGQGGVDTGFNGADTAFSTATDTASLTLLPVNDPPIPGSDNRGPVVEDTVLTFPAAPLTANDQPGPPDEAGQSLTVTGVLPVTQQGGTASLGVGTITYTPAMNFNGVDVLYYIVQDNGTPSLSATGAVFITVTPDLTDDYRPYFFYNASNYPAGDGPFDLAVLDFDKDSIPDLAVANYFTNTITLLQGSTSGVFTVFSTLTVQTNPSAVIAGDWNNDTFTDLAVINLTSSSLTILLNNGSGGFTATHYPAGTNAYRLASGKLNGDASPDLAVAVFSEDKVNVFMNNGDGTFAAPVGVAVDAGAGPLDLKVADVDGDTFGDLVVLNLLSNSVSVLLNDGAGNFTLSTNIPVEYWPLSLALADVDGDTDLDLAVANNGDNSVSVLLGNGAGGFLTVSNYQVGPWPTDLIFEDLNMDGKLDLALINDGANTVRVLIGNGAGSFTNLFAEPATTFAVGIGPASIVSGLFNLDGDPDLAVANLYSGNVSILLNSYRLQAYPQSLTMLEDAPTTNITLTGWGRPINYAIVQPPTLGTIGGGPLPNLTYTPNPNANGIDQIGFVVHDGYGHTSAVAYVTITIIPVNDAPSFEISGDPIVIGEDDPLTTLYGVAINISAGPPDEVGQIFWFVSSNNNNGLFVSQPSLRSSGALVLQPAPNAHGQAQVTVQMWDSGGTANGGTNYSAPITFTVIVTNKNDAPFVYPSVIPSRVIYEHGMTTYTLGLHDLESPPSALTLTVGSSLQTLVPTNSTNITWGLDGTGTNMLVNVWPADHEYGSTLLTFTFSDGTNTTSRTTTLQVNPINDQPYFELTTASITWPAVSPGYTNTALITNAVTGKYNGTIDHRETTQALSFWIVNTNTSLFGYVPMINNTTRAFTFKPAGVAGSVTLDVYVRDNGGGTNYQYGPLKLTINLTP